MVEIPEGFQVGGPWTLPGLQVRGSESGPEGPHSGRRRERRGYQAEPGTAVGWFVSSRGEWKSRGRIVLWSALVCWRLRGEPVHLAACLNGATWLILTCGEVRELAVFRDQTKSIKDPGTVEAVAWGLGCVCFSWRDRVKTSLESCHYIHRGHLH